MTLYELMGQVIETNTEAIKKCARELAIIADRLTSSMDAVNSMNKMTEEAHKEEQNAKD